MATEDKEEKKEEAPAKESAPASAASNAEHMIPISRLNEEIDKRKKMEDRLALLEKNSKEAEVKRLKETEDYRALYEKSERELSEVKPRAAIAEESEKTLRSVLDSQVAELPESLRSLIPSELSTQQQLQWLSKNKPLLVKSKPIDIGAGKQGGDSPSGSDLSPEEIAYAKQFGVSAEDYAKHKFK